VLCVCVSFSTQVKDVIVVHMGIDFTNFTNGLNPTPMAQVYNRTTGVRAHSTHHTHTHTHTHTHMYTLNTHARTLPSMTYTPITHTMCQLWTNYTLPLSRWGADVAVWGNKVFFIG